MHKILFFLICLGTLLHAKLSIITSILPVQTFIQQIGKEHVTVTVMVKPGNSPHTYEPKPSQMKDISRADLYLAISVEFEKVWLPKFSHQNPAMQIIDLSSGITKEPISSAQPTTPHTHLDPHIWTTPENVKQIAHTILDTLIQADPSHQNSYQKNYAALIQLVEQTDRKLHQILDPLPEERRRFIVFHPSWGYFARAYHLVQIPIEIEGKSPKPRAVQQLITQARKLQIHTVLTSPEFSDAVAKQIANALHATVIKISPMDPDWSNNLLTLAKALSNHIGAP